MRRTARLIDLLVARWPGRDRRELFSHVLRGDVTVNGTPVLKPGAPVPADAELAVRPLPQYVSRGGGKLAAALDRWHVNCAAGPWIDAGSSTGGFTDCLLQRGAPLVFAVDVGEGQLNWGLRADQRVRVMEGTNIMDVRPGSLQPAPSFAAVDLSFRSLRRAARHILGLTASGSGIFLVKPQFEYTDAPAGFRGVVDTPEALRGIVVRLRRDLAAEGVALRRAMPSPIPGRKGNRELLWLLMLEPAADRAAPGQALFHE